MISWTDVLTSSALFRNPVILRRPGVAHFADIIKIAITLIKNSVKGMN